MNTVNSFFSVIFIRLFDLFNILVIIANNKNNENRIKKKHNHFVTIFLKNISFNHYKFLNLKINNQTCLLASSIYFFPFPKTFKNQTYVKYMLLQQSEQGCTLKYVKLRLSNINLLQTFLILRLNLFIFSYMERMSPRKYVLRKSYPKLKAL